MITRIKNGKIINEGKETDGYVYFDGDGITAVCGEELRFDREIDAENGFVCPGFVDIHCHGGGGADFGDGTTEAVVTAARAHLLHGTTSLFPTLMAAEFPETENALAAIGRAENFVSNLCGAHLEGPYLSPAQCGAQKKGNLKLPEARDYLRILDRYKVARWSYAPELDESFAFLDCLVKYGVVAAAAHTDATCIQMKAALDRGCRLITHLYSCTSTITRKNGFRTAGVTEAAYLYDGLSAELIADGKHLPDQLIRLAYKIKGSDRLALVTDAMRAAGTELKESFIGKEGSGVRCIIEDGVAKLPDRSAFAGSVATADMLVRTCVEAGVSLAEAVKMMTETPAKIMNLSGKGALSPGYDADIVILDKKLNVKKVISKGEIA